MFALSYLMGAVQITDDDLIGLGIGIAEREGDSRKLTIPEEAVSGYVELIKAKLSNGFWNEIVGAREILFIFKSKNGSIQEYALSPENEREVDMLCSEFNSEPPGATHNVFQYISRNSFYHDFMLEHYADLVGRP